METNLDVSSVRNVLYKKYVAEVIGTFFLVFNGCGAAVWGSSGNLSNPITLLGISFSFGLTVVAMAYTFGNISGYIACVYVFVCVCVCVYVYLFLLGRCHINPCITVAMIINNNIDVRSGLIYIASQFVGIALLTLFPCCFALPL